MNNNSYIFIIKKLLIFILLTFTITTYRINMYKYIQFYFFEIIMNKIKLINKIRKFFKNSFIHSSIHSLNIKYIAIYFASQGICL